MQYRDLLESDSLRLTVWLCFPCRLDKRTCWVYWTLIVVLPVHGGFVCSSLHVDDGSSLLLPVGG